MSVGTAAFRLARVLIVVTALAASVIAAEPLSKEDVALLILSGATSQKKAGLIQQRGISFVMTPEITKQFQELGADDAILTVLQNLEGREDVLLAAAAPPAKRMDSFTPLSNNGARIAEAPSIGMAHSVSRALRISGLARPSEDLIEKIIQALLRNDELFREALNNYTYRQIVTVKQLDERRRVIGVYRREWDIVFDDQGRKISRETYAPGISLARIRITQKDAEYFGQALFPTDVLPEYDFAYLDHVQVDKITAYVFSVGPKKMEPGRHYFEGRIWVDDQDLGIVKVEGRQVPLLKSVQNGVITETLFPHFVEYREQIDGRHWFPTVAFSDDTLQFAFGPAHVQVLVRYSNYKAFGAESHVISSNEYGDESQQPVGLPKR